MSPLRKKRRRQLVVVWRALTFITTPRFSLLAHQGPFFIWEGIIIVMVCIMAFSTAMFWGYWAWVRYYFVIDKCQYGSDVGLECWHLMKLGRLIVVTQSSERDNQYFNHDIYIYISHKTEIQQPVQNWWHITISWSDSPDASLLFQLRSVTIYMKNLKSWGWASDDVYCWVKLTGLNLCE